jgi:hypothetical protein
VNNPSITVVLLGTNSHLFGFPFSLTGLLGFHTNSIRNLFARGTPGLAMWNTVARVIHTPYDYCFKNLILRSEKGTSHPVWGSEGVFQYLFI